MSSCKLLPAEEILIGREKIRHVMPQCHVQRYERRGDTPVETNAEMDRQKAIGKDWQASWSNSDYGRFRIDFARRVARDRMPAAEVVRYLTENQSSWPAYDFTDDLAYWQAMADGHVVCPVCHEDLGPPPPCGCGCQGAPPRVAGWRTLAPTMPPPPKRAPETAEEVFS
jgi:hypothetical protein